MSQSQLGKAPEGDVLWDSFVPFWNDLRSVSPLFLLIGGYALTLKQRWLLSDPGIEVMIPLSEWKDQTIRTSRDLDFIVSPEAIGSREVQLGVHEVLERHKFTPVAKRKRWQFEKMAAGHRIKFDVQSFRPTTELTTIKQKDVRFKPRPSMKDVGFQARLNPDVPGGNITPSNVFPQGLMVALMNMYAHLMMKLVAVHDRFERASELFRPEEKRKIKAAQACKHAYDACMIVATLTKEDLASFPVMRSGAAGDPTPARAAEIVNRLFLNESSSIKAHLESRWHPEHLQRINSLLKEWFPH